jgi:acyl carrier protein
LQDPFSADPQARLYRTGDVGRWREDGNIEFLGRNDEQVKIRGYRIELGEIESQLLHYPGVREAVVLARADGAGDKQLVAYYTSSGSTPDVDSLRMHLQSMLPQYMVPAAFVKLDALPLTLNGKLDRKELPAPDSGAYTTQEYEAPSGEVELVIAGIWQELLQVERVGRHDNFFELGAHSLLAIQALNRIQQALDVQISLHDIFAMPQLATLAENIVNMQLSKFDSEELLKLVEVMRQSPSTAG